MVQYAKYLDLLFGCRLSIDNLICEYSLNSYDEKKVVRSVEAVFCKSVPGFNPVKPSSGCGFWQFENRGKFQWFKYMFSGDGVSVSLFKFGAGRSVAPVLRLEVNPNKHWDKPVFLDLRSWISENCVAGTLRKYDVALDVPAPISAVSVITRKAYHFLNGTRYYGQRNKHGHLRVYDKKSELAQKQGLTLDDDLTRLEWTFETRKDCSVSFDDIGVAFGNSEPPPASLRAVVSMASKIRDRLGHEEYELSLLEFDYRTRKKVRAYVEGSHISPCVSADDVRLLLKWYGAELSIAYSVQDGQWFNSSGMIKSVSLPD